MSGEFLTRRQIRELERSGQPVPRPEAKPEQTATSAFALPPEVVDPVLALRVDNTDVIPTRRDLREQQPPSKGAIWPLVPVVKQPAVAPPAASVVSTTEKQPTALSAPSIDESKIPTKSSETSEDNLFDVSPNLSLEPQTASLVIDQVNDITNLTHVLHNGDILQTGSITLPILSTHTGEMALVADAVAADSAVNADATTGYVSTITPVRASEVGNFGAQIDIVPAKHQRGEGQLYLALTISVGLVAVGALILGGYMLNIFN